MMIAWRTAIDVRHGSFLLEFDQIINAKVYCWELDEMHIDLRNAIDSN